MRGVQDQTAVSSILRVSESQATNIQYRTQSHNMISASISVPALPSVHVRDPITNREPEANLAYGSDSQNFSRDLGKPRSKL